LVGKPEGRNHLEDLIVGGRVILKWLVEKFDFVMCIGFIGFRIGTSGRLL
jgi:hypothetical protein